MTRPRLSVVIPTRDRAEFLSRTLAAFTHQTLARSRFEVIVVDNASKGPGTRRVATAFRRRGSFDLRYRREATPGAAAARNAGIKASRGSVLVFMDDTCLPHPGLLAEYDRAHREKPGRVLIGGTRGILSCWSKEALKRSKTTALPLKLPRGDAEYWLFSVDEVLTGFPSMHFFPSAWYYHWTRLTSRSKVGWRNFVSANVSFSKDLIERHGLFNESFRGWGMEDTELGYRLDRAGAEFRLVPGALCFHQQHPMDAAAARKSFRRNLAIFCRLHRWPGVERFRRRAEAQALKFLS